jgi:hypothetical protein
VAPWAKLVHRFGRPQLAEVAASAIAVTPIIATLWRRAAGVLGSQPGFAECFLPSGRAPARCSDPRPMPAHLKVPPRQPSAAAKEKPWRPRLFGIAAALLAVAIALAVLVVALFIQQLVMAG